MSTKLFARNESYSNGQKVELDEKIYPTSDIHWEICNLSGDPEGREINKAFKINVVYSADVTITDYRDQDMVKDILATSKLHGTITGTRKVGPSTLYEIGLGPKVKFAILVTPVKAGVGLNTYTLFSTKPINISLIR